MNKLRATGLVLIVLLITAVLFTACPNNAGAGGAGGSGGAGTGGGGGTPEVPFIEGGAVLILNGDELTIKVKAKTEDSSNITVLGCTETELPSDTETELHAQGTRVTLKGKITELHCSNNQLTALNVQGLTALKGLYCWNNQLTALDVQGLTALQELNCGGNQLTALNVQGLTALQGLDCEDNQLTALNVQGLSALQWLNCGGNQLTALNVQGLTALQELYCYRNQLTALDVQGLSALKRLECYGNKLTAAAFKQLFTGLPQREESDNAECILYSEQADVTEGNHTDFSTPASLKAAFDGAKGRNWKMQKQNASGSWEEI